jgi:hypothetical protein
VQAGYVIACEHDRIVARRPEPRIRGFPPTSP